MTIHIVVIVKCLECNLKMMKTDLLNLLRRQPLTVNALCESLGVTRNAVNV